MFRSIASFFNLLILLILFKIFVPNLFELTVSILTNILTLLNEVIGSAELPPGTG